MRRRRGPAQQGAALLSAMITVTLVATLAAAALWQQWRGVEVEAAERARVQSSWLLNGALDWARLILRIDDSFQVDHLAEPWAVPLAEARLSTFLAAGEANTETDRDAFLSGGIIDLQSRLNVRNLVGSQKQELIANLERFERLFSLLQLPRSELGALVDNLRSALDAEAAGITALPDPLMPQRVSQLVWLGLSPGTVQALEPYVTVLPVRTPINLNTASAQVIHAVVPGLSLAQAQQLVTARSQQYFDSVGAALQRIGASDAAMQGCIKDWCSVNSSFFELRARLRLDDVALEEVAWVRRRGARQPVDMLWRQRVPLTLAVDAAGGPGMR